MSIAEGRTDAEREVLERLRLKGELARALDRANELKARVAELEGQIEKQRLDALPAYVGGLDD